MFKKNIIFIFMTIFLFTSCSTWKDIKTGLEGGKVKSTDEFLVQKKDPLVLPPDYENLPQPNDDSTGEERISSFEKKLKKTSSIEETTSTSMGSVESSILRRIKKK